MDDTEKIRADLETMSRDTKVLLYVTGHLDSLMKKGLVEHSSGSSPMSEEGRSYFRILIEQGFKPTDEEITSAIKFLANPQQR